MGKTEAGHDFGEFFNGGGKALIRGNQPSYKQSARVGEVLGDLAIASELIASTKGSDGMQVKMKLSQ